jgi:hypothetical protein
VTAWASLTVYIYIVDVYCNYWVYTCTIEPLCWPRVADSITTSYLICALRVNSDLINNQYFILSEIWTFFLRFIRVILSLFSKLSLYCMSRLTLLVFISKVIMWLTSHCLIIFSISDSLLNKDNITLINRRKNVQISDKIKYDSLPSNNICLYFLI